MEDQLNETIGSRIRTYLEEIDTDNILLIALMTCILFGIAYHLYEWLTAEEPTYHLVTPEQVVPYQDHDPRFSFDKSDIYFINLDRSEKRRNNVIRQLKEQGLAGIRFSAVDGSKIHLDDPKYAPHLSHIKWWYEKDKKRMGHFGVFLSHMKIFETFLKSDNDYCLIFEDDVEFLTKSFKLDVMDHMRHVPEDWDIVLFGYHINDNDTRVKKGNVNSRLIHNILNITYFTGLHGYMITKKSAQILFTYLKDHEWIIDWNMGILAERGFLKIYGMYRPLICQPAVYDIKVNGLKYTQDCKREMGGMESTRSM
jgi:GR25 family glycosyltransferase involved in LPS biosynthesis